MRPTLKQLFLIPLAMMAAEFLLIGGGWLGAQALAGAQSPQPSRDCKIVRGMVTCPSGAFEAVANGPQKESPKPPSADTTFTAQKYEGPRCKSVPSPDGCNTCSECDGVLTSCTLAYCLKPHVESQTEEKPKPALVVPAILETTPIDPPIEMGRIVKFTSRTAWACADKSRTLLHSEDGKSHWCLDVKALAERGDSLLGGTGKGIKP